MLFTAHGACANLVSFKENTSPIPSLGLQWRRAARILRKTNVRGHVRCAPFWIIGSLPTARYGIACFCYTGEHPPLRAATDLLDGDHWVQRVEETRVFMALHSCHGMTKNKLGASFPNTSNEIQSHALVLSPIHCRVPNVVSFSWTNIARNSIIDYELLISNRQHRRCLQ